MGSEWSKIRLVQAWEEMKFCNLFDLNDNDPKTVEFEFVESIT